MKAVSVLHIHLWFCSTVSSLDAEARNLFVLFFMNLHCKGLIAENWTLL